MNEHKSAALELTESSVDEELVTDYLEQNPDFFDRHPNLLVRMNMRHQQAGLFR